MKGEADREEILDDGVMQITCDTFTILSNRETLETALEAHRSNGGPRDHRKRFDEGFVFLGEASFLVRQIEIPEEVWSGPNRDSEERTHRRMTRWHPHRIRMVGDGIESDRLAFP